MKIHLKDPVKVPPASIGISSKTGQGIDSLRQQMVIHYEKNLAPYRLELKHSQTVLIQEIRKYALVLKEDYTPKGIVLNLRLAARGKAKLESILNKSIKSN